MKKYKEILIKEYLAEPIKKGDKVYVKGLGSQNKEAWGNITTVVNIFPDESIEIDHYSDKLIPKEDYKKWLGEIGVDPFDKMNDRIRSLNFQLESILFQLNVLGEKNRDYFEGDILIMECNWNPYVYDKNGKKEYYQRDFVWSDEDKRLLIDSIYSGVDCGKILVRKRSFDEIRKLVAKGETEVAFNDIVDGKQRLKAMKDFIENKFKDSHGHFYNDLSDMAQRKLVGHQLFSYSELPESSTDSEIVEQFLKLNFTGVPQSKEHIAFIQEINKKM